MYWNVQKRKEKPEVNWNKENGNVRARPHLTKPPISKKELKKIENERKKSLGHGSVHL